MRKRRRTRKVKFGQLSVGGKAPISVQSMTKTDTRDVKATVRQIRGLEKVGCQVIRVAVPDKEAARCLGRIKERIKNLTVAKNGPIPMEEIIKMVNSSLRGWCGYFHYGNSSNRFKRIKSFAFAFRGIFKAFRTEHNLWIQSSIAIVVVFLGSC